MLGGFLGVGVSGMNSIILKKYNTQQLQSLANMPGAMGSSALAELQRRQTIGSFDETSTPSSGEAQVTSRMGRMKGITSRLDRLEDRLNSIDTGSKDVTQPSPTPTPPVQAGGVSGVAEEIQSVSRPEKAAQDMFGTNFMRQESLSAAKIENNKKI